MSTLSRLADFQEKAQKIKNKSSRDGVSDGRHSRGSHYRSLPDGFHRAQVQEIFKDLGNGESLPGLTLFVMGMSNVVLHQGWLVAVVLVVLVIAIKMLGKHPRAGSPSISFKLNAPVFGQLIRKVSIARFTRTLGYIIASGVPILQALNIVRETAGSWMRRRRQVHDAVKEGERMSSRSKPPRLSTDGHQHVDVVRGNGRVADMLTLRMS